MIKLIVSDMDGTLLKPSQEISEANIQAINKAKAKGIDFVIATGRDFSAMNRVIAKYPIDVTYAILGNGAQFVNQDNQIITSSYLNKNYFREIIQLLELDGLYYMVFTTQGVYAVNPEEVKEAFIQRGIINFNNKKEDFAVGGNSAQMPVMKLQVLEDIDQFLKQGLEIIKVEAFSSNLALIEEIKVSLANIEGISYLSSFKDNIEITDIQAQKGLVLKEAIKQLGIKEEEVVVLGDGMNDLTLFENFSNSFAPSNAEEEIKKLAGAVVASCEEDAVAQAINRILGE